jgi:hypothetical protein
MSRKYKHLQLTRADYLVWPAKPVENGLIELFNGRLRDECLDVTEFTSLEHARASLHAWQDGYNHHLTAWRAGSPDPQRRPTRSG